MTHATTDATTKPLRSAFSLTVGERIIAFVVAGCAGYLMYRWMTPKHPPVWLAFVVSSALAVSALCAFRFVGGVETRLVSRPGYLALAIPFAQTIFAAFTFGVYALTEPLIAFPLVLLLWASVLGHFAASCIAYARGVRRKDQWADLATIPLFIAWYFLLIFLVDGSTYGFDRH